MRARVTCHGGHFHLQAVLHAQQPHSVMLVIVLCSGKAAIQVAAQSLPVHSKGEALTFQ